MHFKQYTLHGKNIFSNYSLSEKDTFSDQDENYVNKNGGALGNLSGLLFMAWKWPVMNRNKRPIFT